jgi:hypothetical protein
VDEKKLAALQPLLTEYQATYDGLNSRARDCITAISIILGASFFKLDIVISIAQSHFLLLVAFGFTLAFMFLSLVFVVQSLRIREYTRVLDSDEISKDLKSVPSDEIFYANRANEILKCVSENQKVFDDRASELRQAMVMIVLGLVSAGVFLLLAVLLVPEAKASTASTTQISFNSNENEQ